MRTICVVTATRAEYGLLRPVVQKLAASSTLQLQLVATGAHLCPRLGETVREIEADGVPIAARLPIFVGDENEPVAVTIARTITVFDAYFSAHRPDAVLLLGDRFEIFAAATAAAAASGDFPEIVVSCMASQTSRSSKTGAACALRSSARRSGGEPRASFSTA